MNKYQLFKAGIDVKGALVKFDNNEEFYEKMLQEFVEAPEYEKLCQALLKGEVEQAFEEAHKLKGTTGNLNMDVFYQVVCPLVEALRNENLKLARELFPAVEKSYKTVIAAIGGS